MTATTPIVLLAPAPNMTFAALPSGATYFSGNFGLVTITNGSITDEQALINAGCIALSPVVGGAVTAQPGTSYMVQSTDDDDLILFTGTGATAVTLPNAMPQGFTVELVQASSGVVSVSAASGGTLLTPASGASTTAAGASLVCTVLSNTTGSNAQWSVIPNPQFGGGIAPGAISAALAANVAANIVAVPTGSETAGTVYIVSTSPSGAFAGEANAIAYLQATGAWAFVMPQAGQKIYVQTSGQRYTFLSGTWTQDGVASAITQFASAVAAATATTLPSYSYANGTAGVGATLTGNSNGAFPAIDGVAAALNNRYWVKNETGGNAPYNGLYALTTIGTSGAAYVLTRTSDADTAALLGTMAAFVTGGTTNIGNTWAIPLAAAAITVGTTALVPVQIGGAGGVASETARAEAAEATLTTAVAAETTRAESSEQQLFQDINPPALWYDDVAFQGGTFDANGYPVFATDIWGKAVGSQAEQFVGRTFMWADEPLATLLTPGQLPSVDANGAIVVPYTTTPSQPWYLDNYQGYVTSGGGVALTNNAAKITGLDLYIAGSRGTVRGGPTTLRTILSWMDDATASGNPPYHERRWFDASGAAYVSGISGITKIVPVIDIGHSLTIGGVAGLLTTAPFFARAVMYNGGPKVVQASGSGDNWSTPAPILDDAQIQSIAEYYEFQNSGGQGETHGGGVAYWFAQGANLGATEVVLPASVGAGGATLANLLSGTTQYSNLIRFLERSAAHAAFNGWAWEPHITCSIGENDYTTYATNAATFQSNLIALQSSIQTAVQAIATANGWTAPTYVPLVMIQPSSWTNSQYNLATCALAYVFPALVRAYPNLFVLVGPGYYTDNYYAGTPPQSIHKTALGYKLDGQYNARIVQKLRASAATPGLVVTGVSNSGNTLMITTSATTSLAIDTSVVSDPGQSGLRVLDVTAGNANIVLSGISVSGTTITATLASHTTGHTLMLGVGDIGIAGNNPGPTTGPRTTIRDSSTDVSSTDTNSTAMFNYLCHDQIAWTAAA